jgi:hypothetical protein
MSPECGPIQGVFLFGHFRSELEGKSFVDEDNANEEVGRIVTGIPFWTRRFTG